MTRCAFILQMYDVMKKVVSDLTGVRNDTDLEERMELHKRGPYINFCPTKPSLASGTELS